MEYVPFTNRIALVEEFIPSDAEQKLYNLVSDYLQRENLFALPSSQRKLMTLVLRRLLASSTFAIAGTLEGSANKLQSAEQEQTDMNEIPAELSENFELLEEIDEEWAEEDEGGQEAKPKKPLTPDERKLMQQELTDLRFFADLAKSILKNSKGDKLLTALRNGLKKTKELGAERKGHHLYRVHPHTGVSAVNSGEQRL